MNNAGLHVVSGNTVPIASEALEPVDHGDQDVIDAAGFQFIHDLEPELGAFGLLDPQPQHLLSPSPLSARAT